MFHNMLYLSRVSVAYYNTDLASFPTHINFWPKNREFFHTPRVSN